MGIRRMFHGDVVESDGFLDMPLEAQALYFHLGMEADVDGLVNCARQVARRLGLKQDAIKPLIESGFVFFVEDVLVIRHFRQANSLKNDRLKLPRYQEISKKIYLCSDKSYSQKREKGAVSLYTFKRRMIREYGIQRESLKRREGKINEGKINEKSGREENQIALGTAPGCCDPHARDREGELKFMGGKLGQGVLLLSDQQTADLLEQMGLDGFDYYAKRLTDYILTHGATVRNHYATMLKWWKEDTKWKKE